MTRLFALALLALSLAACHHAEGDACGDRLGLFRPEPYCDGSDFWICSGWNTRTGDGVWQRMTCKGAGGCGKAGERFTCDVSGNAPGDACFFHHTGDNTLEACSASLPETMLKCSPAGVLEAKACSGCAETNDHLARCASAAP